MGAQAVLCLAQVPWHRSDGMGGGGKGWGYGGKGSMVWMPNFQKGFGKGKGKGKGLKSFKAEEKVWIGGIPDGVTYKELMPHMKQAGNVKWVEVFEGNGK